jgi:hypothetical protein
MRELGRHIYPEVGMYCAIDGDVYDIGRKYYRTFVILQYDPAR